MVKSKKTKSEKQEAKQLAREQGVKALFILGFAGNLASAIMYTHLISNPETGMQVLAGINIITAAYFLHKSIQ